MDYKCYLKLTLLRQQFRTMASNFQKHLKKKMKSVNLKIIYLIAQVIPSIVFHYHKRNEYIIYQHEYSQKVKNKY